jgi:pimeloyl-ACP methyl ester carboxylesterase
MDFRERDVSVRGLSLRIRERGPREGPACFLLHGWLDHRGSFDLLAPLLSGRTVAYDHRGHGDSAWVGAGAFYHFVEYLGDLDGLVRELSPEGPLRLVGHSMGGALSLLYAAARPDRVAHVTMLDAAPLLIRPDEVPARLSGWLEDLAKPRERRAVRSLEDARDRLVRGNPELGADAARLLAEGAVGPDPDRPGTLAWKWDPLLRARSPLPYTQEVLQCMLPLVRVPVLLLRAEQGQLPEERELRTRFASLPDLTVETIPGTSHHLHLEEPRVVAERIQRDWDERRR